jgi:ribosome-associated protein
MAATKKTAAPSTKSAAPAKRPTISSSHKTPGKSAGTTAAKSPARASVGAKAEKPTKASSGSGSVRPVSKGSAKPATKAAAEPTVPGKGARAAAASKARAAALPTPASKPIPKAKKSALAEAATSGKATAAKKGALPSPERKADKRRPASRDSEAVDPTQSARERALQIAAAGLDKKASDVAIIDVFGKVDYADYLVLMTGTSDRHVASIVQAVEEDQRKHNERALSVEGLPIANWVLVDFADVVVHVFQEDARGTYDLDGLWMDAARIPVKG